MRIGVLSHLYPTLRHKFGGIFVQRELEDITRHVEVRLISPIPNQYWFGETHSGTAEGGYPYIRPFVLAFPRWFKQHWYPASLALTLSRNKHFFEGCDLVHAHNAFPDAVAAVRTFGERLPVVVTVHGSDINLFARKPSLQPDIVSALNRARVIVCVSSSLVARLSEIGVSSETVVIHDTVDTDLFTPGDRREACLRLGLDPDRPRLLFMGNFYPGKGIDYLIASFPDVVHHYPDCELVLVGAPPGGREAEKYLELAGRLGVKERVVITERVPHDSVPVWMRAANVFMLPSLAEGFGIVAAEALSCGTPVVATRCGGPEDIVQDGLGFLVPPRDAGALGEAALKALSGNGIAHSDILAKSVRERFSREQATQRLLEVYHRALRPS